MIRAVIIDDEPNNIDALRALIGKFCPGVEVVGCADNLEDGYNTIKSTGPDLVFLDIEMPYGNSFTLLDRLKPVSFEVIFVTAFENYAINAIKHSALDYLLKPVNIRELQLAVQKAESEIQANNINSNIKNFVGQVDPAKNLDQKISLPSHNGLVFIKLAEFIRMEASSNYTAVYLTNKSKLLISKTLKEFEDILPPAYFSRVHHSHIINHQFIKRYYHGRGGYIEMEDGTHIEVSSRKKESFLAKFG